MTRDVKFAVVLVAIIVVGVALCAAALVWPGPATTAAGIAFVVAAVAIIVGTWVHAFVTAARSTEPIADPAARAAADARSGGAVPAVAVLELEDATR